MGRGRGRGFGVVAVIVIVKVEAVCWAGFGGGNEGFGRWVVGGVTGCVGSEGCKAQFRLLLRMASVIARLHCR